MIEKGNGVRYNGGKTRYELLPVSVIAKWANYQWANYLDDAAKNRAIDILELVGEFQKTADPGYLNSALIEACSESHGFSGLKDAADVFNFGLSKYVPWNWAKGMSWSTVIGCLVRHLLAIIEDGQEIDPESCFPHMGHVKCNLIMLMTFVDTYPEGNDLPVGLI